MLDKLSKSSLRSRLTGKRLSDRIKRALKQEYRQYQEQTGKKMYPGQFDPKRQLAQNLRDKSVRQREEILRRSYGLSAAERKQFEANVLQTARAQSADSGLDYAFRKRQERAEAARMKMRIKTGRMAERLIGEREQRMKSGLRPEIGKRSEQELIAKKEEIAQRATGGVVGHFAQTEAGYRRADVSASPIARQTSDVSVRQGLDVAAGSLAGPTVDKKNNSSSDRKSGRPARIDLAR